MMIQWRDSQALDVSSTPGSVIRFTMCLSPDSDLPTPRRPHHGSDLWSGDVWRIIPSTMMTSFLCWILAGLSIRGNKRNKTQIPMISTISDDFRLVWHDHKLLFQIDINDINYFNDINSFWSSNSSPENNHVSTSCRSGAACVAAEARCPTKEAPEPAHGPLGLMDHSASIHEIPRFYWAKWLGPLGNQTWLGGKSQCKWRF